MGIELYSHQKKALSQMKVGSILRGGTGSGKSMTGLSFYFSNVCGGKLNPYTPMTKPRDLYIITTAHKRDTCDWERECARFLLTTDSDMNVNGNEVIIDSWNNIKKYVDVKDAFFIFDEQKVSGSGTWAKTFVKIAKKNDWILLTATPGDTWMDYIPVFVANGFYKNRTEFVKRHVVWNSFLNFPKVDRYLEEGRLIRLRDSIMINMEYVKDKTIKEETVYVGYDEAAMQYVMKNRFNIFKDEPIKNASELFYTVRKLVNSDFRRLEAAEQIVKQHHKVIIFYNFDYELELLRMMGEDLGVDVYELNGHKHENLPEKSERGWIYLVQYYSGQEAWECFDCNTMIFYSLNYSYKTMIQSKGRIDRLNTPFKQLYYYTLSSKSWIDQSIAKCLRQKKDFNEKECLILGSQELQPA